MAPRTTPRKVTPPPPKANRASKATRTRAGKSGPFRPDPANNPVGKRPPNHMPAPTPPKGSATTGEQGNNAKARTGYGQLRRDARAPGTSALEVKARAAVAAKHPELDAKGVRQRVRRRTENKRSVGGFTAPVAKTAGPKANRPTHDRPTGTVVPAGRPNVSKLLAKATTFRGADTFKPSPAGRSRPRRTPVIAPRAT